MLAERAVYGSGLTELFDQALYNGHVFLFEITATHKAKLWQVRLQVCLGQPRAKK